METNRSFLATSNGKYVLMIGLKAPENYSASFRYNKISTCLWQGPKTFISMISGSFDVSRPPEPIIFMLGDTRTPKQSRKIPKPS